MAHIVEKSCVASFLWSLLLFDCCCVVVGFARTFLDGGFPLALLLRTTCKLTDVSLYYYEVRGPLNNELRSKWEL